jgi:hypothetical protein
MMTTTTTIEIQSHDKSKSSTAVTDLASPLDWNTTWPTFGINETVSTMQVTCRDGDRARSEPHPLPTTLISISETPDVPVIGLNSPLFMAIHSVALFSLFATMVVSFALLIFLCMWDKKGTRRKRDRVRRANDLQVAGLEPLQTAGKGSCQQNVTANDRRRLSEISKNSSIYKNRESIDGCSGRTSASWKKRCEAR